MKGRVCNKNAEKYWPWAEKENGLRQYGAEYEIVVVVALPE
jgi:hypothetical protein